MLQIRMPDPQTRETCSRSRFHALFEVKPAIFRFDPGECTGNRPIGNRQLRFVILFHQFVTGLKDTMTCLFASRRQLLKWCYILPQSVTEATNENLRPRSRLCSARNCFW